MDFNRLFRVGITYKRLYEWTKPSPGKESSLKYSREYEELKDLVSERVAAQFKLEMDTGVKRKFSSALIPDSQVNQKPFLSDPDDQRKVLEMIEMVKDWRDNRRHED